jgi:hypothetical protein|tara:strand:- start:2445 stop:3602 length:1158 start_codon:yes stop_codon:yes gene_type:complete
MKGTDKELAQSYDVGFTMEDPADIRARDQAEFEEQQLNDVEDQNRWSAGRDASTSQEFWDALDATDPLSFALAGGAGSAAAPASWRGAERAHEAAGEPLSAAVRSAEASRRSATGALNRRNRALVSVGVEKPTNYPNINVDQSNRFFEQLTNPRTGFNPRTDYFQGRMIESSLKKRPPGFKVPRNTDDLYWATQKVIEEGGFVSPGDIPTENQIHALTNSFIKKNTYDRASWSKEVVRRRAVVASAQAAEAAHNTNKAWKVAKGVGGKALKAAGVVGGAAGAAFMPTFMAMKQMANQGKLDATLAYMSYDLKGGPLEGGDLTDATYGELVGDVDMADKLNKAGVLSTDLHRSILQTAIREHVIEQTEIGQEGSPERYLEPFRMGE